MSIATTATTMSAPTSTDTETNDHHAATAATATTATSYTSGTAVSTSITTVSTASDNDAPCPWLPAFAGTLLCGTAGWTDQTIAISHLFYPAGVKTAVDRLQHYSTVFPFVEVDSSNYAVPPASRVQSWLDVTPQHFLFSFKVFGLFTLLPIKRDAMPGPLRDELNTISKPVNSNDRIHYHSLPQPYLDKLWQYWNKCIEPAHTANKLGLTLFQFQLGFQYSEASMEHIRACRRGLDPRYRMGVEFRDRSWVSDENLTMTVDFLTALNVTLIAEDDLEEEVRNPRGAMSPSHYSLSPRLPIVLALTSDHSVYIRMHRRVGLTRGDRVLHSHEFDEYRQRLMKLHSEDDGSPKRVYYWSIGTDCQDDPITNYKLMTQTLRDTPLALDWAAIVRAQMKQKQGSISAMFQRQIKRERQEDQVTERDDDDSGGDGDVTAVDSKASSQPPSPAQSSTLSASAPRLSVTTSRPVTKKSKTAAAAVPTKGTPSIMAFFPKSPAKDK